MKKNNKMILLLDRQRAAIFLLHDFEHINSATKSVTHGHCDARPTVTFLWPHRRASSSIAAW